MSGQNENGQSASRRLQLFFSAGIDTSTASYFRERRTKTTGVVQTIFIRMNSFYSLSRSKYRNTYNLSMNIVFKSYTTNCNRSGPSSGSPPTCISPNVCRQTVNIYKNRLSGLKQFAISLVNRSTKHNQYQ